VAHHLNGAGGVMNVSFRGWRNDLGINGNSLIAALSWR
jgi:hypothetical protein